MSNLKKTYFLSPSWDYPPPPDGPLRLGNIIPFPDRPVPSLYTAPKDLVPAPGQSAQPDPAALKSSATVAVANASSISVASDGSNIAGTDNYFRTEKRNVTWSKEKLKSGKFGVWTEFLSFLGLGIDVGTGWNSNTEQMYTFDSMVTVEIQPSASYLELALTSPNVARFLARSRFGMRRPVYIITGIKYVSGAKCKTITSQANSGDLKVGLDGTLTGAPINFGPEMSGERKTQESTGFEGGDDFVFAYRVQRVLLKGEDIVNEDYRRGALLSSGRGSDKKPEGEEEQEPEEEVLEALGLSDDPVQDEETQALMGKVDFEEVEDDEEAITIVRKPVRR